MSNDPVKDAELPVVDATQGVITLTRIDDAIERSKDVPPLRTPMWRITTKHTIYGETIPAGLRNDDGFVCQFLGPTHWAGQDARYAEECALLRKHAEIMCAALNRSEAEHLLIKE